MNERIDVMAQLRTTYCPPECLAAIAELIEAAREYRESSVNFYGQLITPSAGSLGRLNTALAHVGAP